MKNKKIKKNKKADIEMESLIKVIIWIAFLALAVGVIIAIYYAVKFT